MGGERRQSNLIHCGHYNSQGLVSLTGTEDLQVILLYPIKAKAVAQYLINRRL